ncbi:Lipopolysaccharide export system permease protein LptF [Polaromonas vacuolata]|uniref:Lipopolysaccharide export system permease protein LptF n=1 Tax=Polaromonas vacuolata TaxID=37448 RepID=A0A6H2H9A1_9BURK|nr:LPS export ABC transporter permease LptF [Polaromonas vacuolata]QJC56435.1 Lipopolysaccharide export system permease protein LptF [Polaromonas vacuolata]
MLFQSSIRKELARSFGATLVVLITIVMTIVLIRTLGQASRGSIDPQDVMLFMAYSAMGRLPTILSLSLFIAMVSTLSRMYRDSEMVVWFTSGQGLWGFLRPLYRFAWPVLLIITLMSMFVWPWANQQTQDMRERYESRSDLDRIAPGQFQESSNGSRVFFIDAGTESAKKTSNNVFISANTNGKNTVITANSGRIEMRGKDQLLLLENGQRVERIEGKNALKISEFQEYGTNTGTTNTLAAEATEAKLLSTRDLLKAPSLVNRSELAWRLGLLLSALNLVVLAVALASVNPRGGRSGNMIFVLLTFIVYNNLLNLGQNWIYSGLVSFGGFLITLHGGVLLLGLAWLAKRHSNWTLKSMLRMNSRNPVTEKTSV